MVQPTEALLRSEGLDSESDRVRLVGSDRVLALLVKGVTDIRAIVGPILFRYRR